LKKIGNSIPANAEFPDWVNDLETGIKAINIAYRMNHRKNGVPLFDAKTGQLTGGIGYYGYEKVEDRNMIICECKNPYPSKFDRDIIEVMVKRFAHSGSAG
jgi:hypothetical protein